MTPDEKAAFCRRMGIPYVQEEKKMKPLPARYCVRPGCHNPVNIISASFKGQNRFCSPACRNEHVKSLKGGTHEAGAMQEV